jgi:branched-chain amino acid aminotransferase
MVTTRGVPLPGMPRKPSLVQYRFFAYALPWIDILSPEIQERGAHAIIAKPPRIDRASVDPTIKNYHWADLTQGLFEAEDKGADVCLLLDAEGYVTEGPGFNVFAVKGGEVVTPDRGVLEGITRLAVIDLCKGLEIPVREGRLTAAELYAADEVFFSSTAGGVIPATRIDDTIYANDSPGPVSIRLKEAYWQAHADGALATPIDYGE